MTTVKRSLVIVAVGAAAALITVTGVWLSANASRGVYTDGGAVRVPTHDAPVRSILWEPALVLPGSINSTSDEYEPRFSADGALMVFVRGKPGANPDLFSCRRTPQGWTEPAPVASINSASDELGPELSPDGGSLYFYSDRAGGLGGYDLWVATASTDGTGAWSTPVNLGPAVNTPANEYGPALSADGAELFFASNRPRPGEPALERDAWAATVRETRDRHDYDIYFSRVGETGAEAAALVMGLNTPADEGSPAFSPAGDFLYFASDRGGGLGGFDIYRARRVNGQFREPENVGSAINSAYSDLDPALSYDGFRLHFSSNRPTEPAREADDRTPRDYGVWMSRSREVYRDFIASGASFWQLLGATAPWLLLLLLLVLLALILPRLWTDERMRGRFRRLSLLAQCLLVSLAMHVLIASLLTLWKVGTKISEMMGEQGGTRVILASAGDGEGGGGGGVVTQLRGGLTDEAVPAEAPSIDAAGLAPSALTSESLASDAAATNTADSARLERTVELGRADALLASETILPAAPRAGAVTSANAPAPLPATAGVEEARAAISPPSSDAPPATPHAQVGSEAAVVAPPATLSTGDSSRLADLAAARVADGSATATGPQTPRAVQATPASVVAGATPSAVSPAAANAEASFASGTSTGPQGPAPATAAGSLTSGAVHLPASRLQVTDSSTLRVPSETGAGRDAVTRGATSIPVAPVLAAGAERSTASGAAIPSVSEGTRAAEAAITDTADATGSHALQSAAPAASMLAGGSYRTDPAASTLAADALRAGISAGSANREEAARASTAPNTGAATASPLPSANMRVAVAAPSAPAGGGPAQTGSPEATLSAGPTAISPPAAPSLSERGSGAADGWSAVRIAPGASATPEDARASVGASRDTGAAAARDAAVGPASARNGSGAPDVRGGSPIAVAVPGSGPASPKSAGGDRGGEAEAGPVGVGASIGAAGVAPVGGGLASGEQTGHRQVTNPGSTRAGDTARLTLAPTARADAARADKAGTASRGVAPAVAPRGGGVASLTFSLPIAEEPPAPKETFDQRAPEVRNEILDKMGGSVETEKAVGRALDWFARHQEPNGGWTGQRFDDRCRECGGHAEFDSDAAMTGLALLCYLGAGHTHDAPGPYQGVIRNGLQFLLSRQEASGDLRRGETMYSQSIATVALCEAYAMTRDARLGEAARRAVAFMCEGVKRAAGRRQDERSIADDTSVLGWQVMAMESARRCGFTVPETTFRSAGAFLDKVAARRTPGRYAYSPGEAASPAMTAEAMFVRQLLGASRDEERMKDSAEFILQAPPRWKDGAYTYYWYYATLALFQHQGEAWTQWNEAIVPELLANQRKDAGAAGSWDPQDQWSKMGGRIYQTAVCTLSLEVYYRYKPAPGPIQR